MHIHANNNLLLASIGIGREETQAIQAKRAAEVRRKLSSASRTMDVLEDEFCGATARVEAHSYRQLNSPDDGAFGRLFSAKA